MKARSKHSGLTLIEMLVVIGLVGMLASMVTFVIAYIRTVSIRIECQEHMRQIGQTLNQIALGRAGKYPTLDSPTTDASNVPWWAKVYAEWQGAAAARIDKDPSTPGLQLPDQLPALMRVFHCRAAPALDESNPVNLDRSISYGLNFDVKRADGDKYACTPGSDVLAVGPRPGVPQDKDPDSFRFTEIARPGEFILLSEADTEDPSPANRTGGRIAMQATQGAPAHPLHPARIVGRHNQRANVLFADMHLELLEVESPEGKNVNTISRLWTLPDD